MSDFFSILTDTGLAKIANLMTGDTITLAKMAVGNSTIVPTRSQTSLSSEQYRCNLTKVTINSEQENSISAETVIPATAGGFWIREVGIYDSDGDLFAIGTFPSTYKPLASEGSVKELAIRIVFNITNADQTIVEFNNGIISGADTDLSNITTVGQAKFDSKANLVSPEFTGVPTVPNATSESVQTQIANLKYVIDAIAAKANLESPEFTGVPTVPNVDWETDSTQIANTHFVQDAIATKANLNTPMFLGTPSAPTADEGTISDQIATTMFVQNAITALGIDSESISAALAGKASTSDIPVIIESIIRNQTSGAITITTNKTPTSKSIHKNADGTEIDGSWVGLTFMPTTASEILDADDWQIRVS